MKGVVFNSHCLQTGCSWEQVTFEPLQKGPWALWSAWGWRWHIVVLSMGLEARAVPKHVSATSLAAAVAPPGADLLLKHSAGTATEPKLEPMKNFPAIFNRKHVRPP